MLYSVDTDLASTKPRHRRSCILLTPRPRSVALTLILILASSLFLFNSAASVAPSASSLADKLNWPPFFHQQCDPPPPSNFSPVSPAIPVLPILNITSTSRFRDKLLPDHQYITSFLTSGWTNDVMSYVHLLQLAIISRRTPILGPFAPSHIGQESGLINFSDVFDIDALSRSINLPILEWHQIKNLTNPSAEMQNSRQFQDYWGGETEDIGCWSLWMTQRENGEPAREGFLPKAFNLDVSWTPVPFDRKVDAASGDLSIGIFALAELGYPTYRELAVKEAKLNYISKTKQLMQKEKDQHPLPEQVPTINGAGKHVDPDHQLMCFDYLYFVQTYKINEWGDEASPQWHHVAVHMRWSSKLKQLTDSYLLRVLGVTQSEAVPLYIGVHIRRSDFKGWCYDVSREDCLAPLEAYERRVDEVKGDLVRQGTALDGNVRVVVTSDEPRVSPDEYPSGSSEAWWNRIAKLGWVWVDHDLERTVDQHGRWYPSLIDAVIQSSGCGFVGTDRSTMSVLAGRRVSDWAGGPTRLVRWGYPDADAH